MSSSTEKPRAVAPRPPKQSRLSKLYDAVMTPLYVISFLISLRVVDFYYAQVRSHSHAEESSRLPRWIHRLLFRPALYQYKVVTKTSTTVKETTAKPTSAEKSGVVAQAKEAAHGVTNGHKVEYTTSRMERRLVRMETEDAFRIRDRVLLLMGVMSIAAVASFGWFCLLVWRWLTTSS